MWEWWRQAGAGVLCVMVVWEILGLVVLLALGVWSVGLVPWGLSAMELTRHLYSLIYKSGGKGRLEQMIGEQESEDKPAVLHKEWGSRLQKYWFMRQPPEDEVVLPGRDGSRVITLAPISKNYSYPVKENEAAMNNFLKSLDHLYIQPIDYIKHVAGDRVVISQPYRPKGSLRDIIHGEATPAVDWSVKYLEKGKPLPTETVVEFGSQILKVMVYLYRKSFLEVKFRPLYHIHTGNVYVVERDGKEECRVGGYENTLLGYRTRLYRAVVQHRLLPYIDVIMFGHIMFEMCSGRELEGVLPTDMDYKDVEDMNCKKIIKYIFRRKKRYQMKYSIEQIKKKTFFTPSKMKSFLKSLRGKKRAPTISLHSPPAGPTSHRGGGGGDRITCQETHSSSH